MSQYKYILFFIALFSAVPLSLFARGKTKFQKKMMAAIVFLLSLSSFLDINFMSAETYRGTVRGFEVTIVDLIVLVLFGSVCLDSHIKKRVIIPGFWVNILFILCALLSLLFSSENTYALYGYFAIFQYVRALVLYWTFYHLINDESDYQLLIKALGAAILLNTVIALYERYVLHMHRIPGLVGHPNLLGAYSSMIGIVLLYVFLKKPRGKKQLMVLACGLSAIVTTILTISKGAITSMAIGLALAMSSVFSLRRNIITLGVTILLTAIIWFKAGDTVMERVTNPNLAGEVYREEMINVSVMLAKENIFGCGYNNYSHRTAEYFPFESAPTHSIYYLTLGEMGYLGLLLFCLIWAKFISMGLKQFFVKENSIMPVVIQGITIALITLLINSTLEDHPRRTVIMYLVAIYWAYLAKGSSILKREHGKLK